MGREMFQILGKMHPYFQSSSFCGSSPFSAQGLKRIYALTTCTMPQRKIVHRIWEEDLASKCLLSFFNPYFFKLRKSVATKEMTHKLLVISIIGD